MSGGRRRFLEDALVSITASGGASVLHWAQIVVCGRTLANDDFGTLGSLLACVWLSTVAGNTLAIGVTREVAGRAEAFDSIPFARELGRRWTRRGWPLILAAVAASPVAARLLHTGTLEVLVTMGAVGALLASSVAQGMTSGCRRFRLQGWLALVAAALKLAATAAILAAAPTVVGALAGSALGYLAVVAGTLAVLRGGHEAERRPVPVPAAPAQPMGRRLVAVYFLGFAPFMIDQVLVQVVAPGLAGDYVALATLGKLPFHAVAPVMAVLFAYLVVHRAEPAREKLYFRLGVALVLGLAVVAAGLLSARPAFVAGTLLSSRYEHVGACLPAYAGAVAAFTLAHSLVLRLLARGDTRMGPPLAATLVLQVLLLLTRHGSLAALTGNQVLTYSAMAVVLLVGPWRPARPRAALPGRAAPPEARA